MNKSIIKLFLLGGLTITSITSCTDNYMDYNKNPYEVTDDEMERDAHKLGAALVGMQSVIVPVGEHLAQFSECLLGGVFSGYMADSKTWGNSFSYFNQSEDWNGKVYLDIMPEIYSNLAEVKKSTTDPIPLAVAEVLKVTAIVRVTDVYGPIPYSKIGQDGKITIPYDTQEEVYNAFFKELDESIEVLTENRNAALVASADFVYSGNVQKWVKFANSLKLRLAIRIANVSPAKAKEMAESAVNHELGLIETNADNATWKYFGTISNPLFVAVRYNEEASGGDTHPAADIICYMNGYNDNRRASYFEESKWPGETYVGLRRGINLSKMKEYFINYSRVKISSSDPVLWMNAAEVAFLRAEATAIYGFNMKGTAADFYEQGVRLSFEQWGATGVDSYLADESSVPALYKDPAGLNTYEKNLSAITVKWNEGASKEEKQERIITQKWIANWPLGNEAWADYRRTGYPKLLPATSEGNLSGGIVDSEKGARRMPYPSEEYTSNTENVQEAVNSYLGGPDNMATDVWWARK